MSESKFYHFSAKGLFYGVATLDEAIAALREDGFVWFNYFQPEREDLSTLIDTIGIHPLSVEDCFDEEQVPKIEHFSNNTFLIFNSFTYKEKESLTDEVNLFIGKDFLITVSGNKSEGRRPLGNIEGIIANDPSNASQGPAFLMHRILDFIVDQKYNLFDTLEDELEEAEESLLENVSGFQPMDLIRLRRNLVNMRKTLFHEREILVKINRMDCPFIPEKALAAYRDVYDHLTKFFDLTETYREIESSLMELYTSLLNYHMTKVSNETNSAVRRLTLIATIFMPLTLLAGIGGMSEWTMMTGPSNWKITYPLFILGMIIIAGINYFLIRRLEKRGVSKRKFTGED